MALLTKQQCRKQVKLRQKTVPFPELGGEILFEELNGEEWGELDKTRKGYAARLIIAAARDEQGLRFFDQGDFNWLAIWPVHLLERGAMAVLECCGLAGGQEEDLLKNSLTPSTPPSGGSPSPEDKPGASS
jgi:hypothetical protein